MYMSWNRDSSTFIWNEHIETLINYLLESFIHESSAAESVQTCILITFICSDDEDDDDDDIQTEVFKSDL